MPHNLLPESLARPVLNEPTHELHPPAAPLAPSERHAPARLSFPRVTYGEVLKLALPLMLSQTGFMLMHAVDAYFLSKYSRAAIAASVPAGMTGFTVMGLFIGAAGYVSTFVAQYYGAGRTERVGAAVWQGIYFSLLTGALCACSGFLADPLFAFFGHTPEVRELESAYFKVMCWSAPAAIVASALSGFFSGLGATRVLMFAQLAGFVVNGVLSYLLIFGKCGCPELGAVGAAAAAGIAQATICVLLFARFLTRTHREKFGTWSGRAFNGELFVRLLRFGFPSGLRLVVEIAGWTVFLLFVGRVGEAELAATNIAWRLNGFAFFPILGLSTAISTLVGQAQGQGDSERARQCVMRGLVLAETWMLLGAALFVGFARPLYGLFQTEAPAEAEQFGQIVEFGAMLMLFVGVYCISDGLNYVFLGALQGAGDTRWTFAATLVITAIFFGGLWLVDYFQGGLYGLWAVATAFIVLQAGVWWLRFHGGKWKTMRVIEPEPTE